MSRIWSDICTAFEKIWDAQCAVIACLSGISNHCVILAETACVDSTADTEDNEP